jgi:tetratricopeptide (TPR) repeat protein
MQAETWSRSIAEAEHALGMGDAARAAVVLASAASDPTAPIAALRLSARVLRALGRHGEACAPLIRLVELQPASASAEHNLAAAEGDDGAAQASHDAARRALAKGGDAPETWLVLARALMALSRLDEAEQAFRESLIRRPLFADALRDLAQLIWMRDGDAGAALAVIDSVLSSEATEPLVALRARVARDIVGDRAAYAQMQPFLHQPHGSELALAAYAATFGFDAGKALTHAEQAVRSAPADPSARTALFAAQIAAGRADETLDGLESLLRLHPHDQYALALRQTAWRVLGDERALTPADYARLVGVFDLTTPDGVDRAEWLSAAAAELRRLHPFRAQPFGQSILSGVQAARDPRRAAGPAVDAIFEALPAPIGAYVAAMAGRGDPMSVRARAGFEITGAWSVRLTAGGRHTDHIHPKGWISSALYVETPEQTPDQPRAGWLRFGACRLGGGLELPPEYWIEPKPGRVALFPSWMWHGTEPFTGGGERLTVAFDVQPR